MKIEKKYIIIIGVLVIIIAIILWFYFNKETEVTKITQEIIPEQEITDEQLRNTIVTLFFINNKTGELDMDSKLIDVKKLINNPYEELINLWLLGSNNENLKNNCSKNVKLNAVKLEDNCLIVDLSKEFIDEYKGDEKEVPKTIYGLVNTLTELTEVDCVKITINGEENKYLGSFNLSEKYYRIIN